jgi:tellurite resistance protein
MALEWLKQRFNEVSTGLKAEVTKLKNKSFLEATVAGCVIVAHADGVVKPEEKQKMMGFLRNSEVLSVFSTEEIIVLSSTSTPSNSSLTTRLVRPTPCKWSPSSKASPMKRG